MRVTVVRLLIITVLFNGIVAHAQSATPAPLTNKPLPFVLDSMVLPETERDVLLTLTNLLTILAAESGVTERSLTVTYDPSRLVASFGYNPALRASTGAAVVAMDVTTEGDQSTPANGAAYVASLNLDENRLITFTHVIDSGHDGSVAWVDRTVTFQSDVLDEDGKPSQPSSTTYILSFGLDSSPWVFEIHGSTLELRNTMLRAWQTALSARGRDGGE